MRAGGNRWHLCEASPRHVSPSVRLFISLFISLAGPCLASRRLLGAASGRWRVWRSAKRFVEQHRSAIPLARRHAASRETAAHRARARRVARASARRHYAHGRAACQRACGRSRCASSGARACCVCGNGQRHRASGCRADKPGLVAPERARWRQKRRGLIGRARAFRRQPFHQAASAGIPPVFLLLI